MAPAPLTFPVSGMLLDITREIGDFIPKGETEKIAWDYTALHILVGRVVHIIRLPKGVHVAPGLTVGKPCTVSVEVPPKTKMTTDLDSIGLGEKASEAPAARVA